jgi:hypothetical protein
MASIFDNTHTEFLFPKIELIHLKFNFNSHLELC